MRQVLLTHATHPLLDEEKREGGRQRGRGWHKESGRFVR